MLYLATYFVLETLLVAWGVFVFKENSRPLKVMFIFSYVILNAILMVGFARFMLLNAYQLIF